MFGTLPSSMDSTTKGLGVGCAVTTGCGCLVLLSLVVLSGIAAMVYVSNNDRVTNLEQTTNTVSTPELFNSDGTSLGFAIDPDFVSDALYTYQVGAFAAPNMLLTQPEFQVSLNYPQVDATTFTESDTGSFWLGLVLDNDYFIQVGMISTDQRGPTGVMQWDYFWEMWDDQNVYRYGLEAPMSNYLWDTQPSNLFAMRCVDPTTGEWEFSINGVIVGTTHTINCQADLRNANVFWEITTPLSSNSTLPSVGPFNMNQFYYAEQGSTLQPVLSATVSYSYGRIVDGAVINQAMVCPPYGAASLGYGLGAQFGSGLNCLAQDSFLWGG